MASTAGDSSRVSLQEFDRIFESVKTWGRWGTDDQRGTLNELTTERTAAAAALVRSGRTVTLAHSWESAATADQPKPPLHYLANPGGPETWGDQMAVFTDFIGADYHNERMSHVDALCHIAYRGRLYNGVPLDAVGPGGAARLAMDAADPGIVGRGVLLDIPRLRGVPWLEPGETIRRAELEAVEQEQGVRLEPGDILLVRTVHTRQREALGPRDGRADKAGLHPDSMPLLHERRVAVLGCDGISDARPSPVEGVPMPIHVLAMTALGMLILDSLQLEDLAAACEQERRWAFLCVIAPLRLPRATGSPVNPLAVF